MAKKLFTILTAVVLLTSCFRKEDFNLDMLANEQDIDYDLALPLFETRYTVGNLLYQLQSANVTTDKEGLVHFIFPDLSSVNFWDGINVILPAGRTSIEISPVFYMQFDTVVSYSRSDTMDFFVKNQNGSDIFIDSALFTEFNISLNVKSGVDVEVKAHLVFPTLINRSTNAPATLDMTVPKGGEEYQKITLTNVRWNAADNRSDKNQYRVPVVTTFTVDLNTATNTTQETGSVEADISFNAFDYYRLYGNIGTEKHTLKASISTNAFLDLPVDKITLYRFLLSTTMSLKNLSIPVRLSSNKVCAIKNNGDTIVFNPPIFPEPYDLEIPRPTDIPFERITTEQKDILQEITINEIQAFYGEFVVETNPPDLVHSQNVLEKNAEVVFDFDIDIPMDLAMANYHLSETIEFDMFTPEQMDLIHIFDLKMILKNAFPIDADIDVYFLDENYDTVLPIYKGRIEGGEVGADMHVLSPEVANIEVRLLGEDVEKLKKARWISFAGTFDTKNNKEVKIFAGSEKEGYISLKAGVRAKLKAGSVFGDYIGGGSEEGGNENGNSNEEPNPEYIKKSPAASAAPAKFTIKSNLK